MTFHVVLATHTSGLVATRLVQGNEDDLMPGGVTVVVEYSSVNDKGATALSGRSPIIRRLPLIPCIDVAGAVGVPSDAGIAAGYNVLANGWGLRQPHHCGDAQKVPGRTVADVNA
ncbi:hypothetical protein LL972_16550 [Xanthomonas campestris pv. asclepiadis]|uniref:hypothetical protein n=1 Tax=Xanthomonas campestris TaxID=339 RepID=UPI001E6126B9|nr:hypothetical protein [Xanthomonas campestris]MCC4617590.1 hypothetical protein [Xanthomonas campestris pv. asclepiadis]